MQWVVKTRVWKPIADFADCESPHLGVFFEAFPARVFVGGQPLCGVKHVEESGWRSSGRRILFSHMHIAKEIDRHLRAHIGGTEVYKQLYHLYSKNLYKLYLRVAFGWLGREIFAWASRYCERASHIVLRTGLCSCHSGLTSELAFVRDLKKIWRYPDGDTEKCEASAFSGVSPRWLRNFVAKHYAKRLVYKFDLAAASIVSA